MVIHKARLDHIADILALPDLAKTVHLFYSRLHYTVTQTRDVVIGTPTDIRLIMIPNERQNEAFTEEVTKRLKTEARPHLNRPHIMGNDHMLSKMVPVIKLMTRQQYIIWTIQRLTRDVDPGYGDGTKKKKKKKKKKAKVESDETDQATSIDQAPLDEVTICTELSVKSETEVDLESTPADVSDQ